MRFLVCASIIFGVLLHPSLSLGSDQSEVSPITTEVYVKDGNITKRAPDRIGDDLVKKFEYFAQYNAAAYCQPQQGKSGGKVTCGSYKSCPLVDKSSTVIQGTWKELGTTGATGFVASDHGAKVNVLAIRGSVSAANWATDGRYTQVECPEYGGKGSKCNDGYYAVWSDCKKPAMDAMEKAIAAYPDYKLVVTGHSLGATTAVYAVADLRNMGKNATLYTYGQPRAGNEQFTQWITNQGGNYRITHTSDFICNLPPETGYGVYRHISPEYWIKSGYGQENDIVKIEGLSNRNGVGSASGMNILAHIGYFQRNMYKCVISII